MQSWLDALGAVGNANGSRAFPSSHAALAGALEHESVCVLDGHAVIRVHGADALDFLQAQLTVDMEDARAGRFVRGAWCTAAGRVCAIVAPLQHGDDFLLLTHASVADAVAERMRLYVLRARVKLCVQHDWYALGLMGERVADTAARAAGLALPGHGVVNDRDAVLASVPGVRSRWLIVAPEKVLDPVCDHVAGKAPAAGSQPWQWIDVVSGLPEVCARTAGHFLPQEINLDLLGGVSFDKGCYPGQEVIARLHYRGRPARRMSLAHAEGERMPEPGEPVFAVSEAEPLGEVVCSAAAPQGGAELLCTVSTRRRPLPALRAGDDPGSVISLRPEGDDPAQAARRVHGDA